jgi:hypothetical protein
MNSAHSLHHHQSQLERDQHLQHLQHHQHLLQLQMASSPIILAMPNSSVATTNTAATNPRTPTSNMLSIASAATSATPPQHTSPMSGAPPQTSTSRSASGGSRSATESLDLTSDDVDHADVPCNSFPINCPKEIGEWAVHFGLLQVLDVLIENEFDNFLVLKELDEKYAIDQSQGRCCWRCWILISSICMAQRFGCHAHYYTRSTQKVALGMSSSGSHLSDRFTIAPSKPLYVEPTPTCCSVCVCVCVCVCQWRIVG